MSDYLPGQRYIGADGDALFVILTGVGTETAFVTNRGTRVTVEEAERVYAPLTLTPSTQDVQDLAAAIRDALSLPYAATGEAWAARDRLASARAAFIVGAIGSFADGEGADLGATVRTVRRADERYPVTYPTADDQAADNNRDVTCVECGAAAVEIGPSLWAHETYPEDGHGVLEVRQ